LHKNGGVTVPRPAIVSGFDDLPSTGGVAVPRPTFAEVYEVHFAFVWRSARRLGTPEGDVDDVVQEIFVVAHRRLREFEGRSSVKTWLFGIIVNVVRAHRRVLLAKHPESVNAQARIDPEALADGAGGPDDWASKVEAARLVDHLLEALDDEKRVVFVLAELEQMTAPEIAAALGIVVNTVYSRLRLARQEFAKAAARHRAREEWSMR
jgi:RNA polymerase sigma-70 factor (ECF subfamily)